MFSSSQKSYVSCTDDDLLSALKADDQGAFAEIYERYWHLLYAFVYRRLKAREVAEELVQDLFEALWVKRTQGAVQQLKPYLFSAINHRVISYIRSHNIREVYAEYCLMRQEELTEETEEQLAEADLSAALQVGVKLLPKKSQEVFRLNRLEHFSVQEISLRLNVSPKAVEYHLTKSLKFLRKHLQEFLPVILPLFCFLQ